MSRLVETLSGFIKLLEGPIGSQTAARQRVQPELLDMIAMKRYYDKEVAALKKPKSQKTTPNTDSFIVYSIRVKVDDVNRWIENRSLEDAFEIGKRWFTSRMPKDFKDDLINDPAWREAVVGVWDRAVSILRDGAETQSLETATFSRAVEHAVRRLGHERGLDKHGNRIR